MGASAHTTSKYDSVDDHVNEGQDSGMEPSLEGSQSVCTCHKSLRRARRMQKRKKKGKKKSEKSGEKKTVSVDAKSKDHTGSITTNDMERKERRLSRVESSRVEFRGLSLTCATSTVWTADSLSRA